MAADRHPGITMHKLSFGGGFIGLVFAAGSALIFILGFPALWYFVALAIALGLGIAVVLRLTSGKMSDHNKPLSILTVPQKIEVQGSRRLENPRNLLQQSPVPLPS